MEATPPYWVLTPVQHEVLGVRESALVQFRLTGIKTEYTPGGTNISLPFQIKCRTIPRATAPAPSSAAAIANHAPTIAPNTGTPTTGRNSIAARVPPIPLSTTTAKPTTSGAIKVASD